MTEKTVSFEMMFVIDTSFTLPASVVQGLSDKDLFNILYNETIQEARLKLSENHVTTWYEVDP